MRTSLVILGLFAATAVGVAGAQPSHVDALRIIVNPANPVTQLDRRMVEDLFLKKVTRWDDGMAAHPVDQPESAEVRRTFSEQILGRGVEAIKSYWERQVFSGSEVPPPELDSDAEVVRYVLEHPGGVGYVSASANLDGAKVVAVK